MLLEIVTALVISMSLLEESLSPVAALGAALVLAAVYLVASKEDRSKSTSMAHA
jgi:drug/metabolite transporter (DMT)-like permease